MKKIWIISRVSIVVGIEPSNLYSVLILPTFISLSIHDEWHSMFVIYNKPDVSLNGDAFWWHKNWHAQPAFHSACLTSLTNEGKHWYYSIKKVYIEPRCSWRLVLVVSQPFIAVVDVLGYFLFPHVFFTVPILIQNVHSCKKLDHCFYFNIKML